jgi:hypothetical protein
MRAFFGIVIAVAIATASGTTLSQTTQEELIGGWSAVSVVDHRDGKDTDVFGKSPMGYMSFAANGRFSIQLMRPDIPKIALNNRTKATPEESAAIAQGLLSYFGSWKLVDPKTGEIAIHVEASSFANWNGADQKRLMTVSGDTLTINNPTSPGGGSATVTLTRVK